MYLKKPSMLAACFIPLQFGTFWHFFPTRTLRGPNSASKASLHTSWQRPQIFSDFLWFSLWKQSHFCARNRFTCVSRQRSVQLGWLRFFPRFRATFPRNLHATPWNWTKKGMTGSIWQLCACRFSPKFDMAGGHQHRHFAAYFLYYLVLMCPTIECRSRELFCRRKLLAEEE